MKRLFDVVVSAVALAALSPLILAVAVAVRATLGGPVLFRHRRPGRFDRPFTLLKFRTMRGERDALGDLVDDERRTSRLGAFLRKTSLDELPELVNVLRGEMSLVGPRPLLMAYLEHYTPEQRRRHEMRPGITGWAQINGRNDLAWNDKLALDVWYVDHASLGLDLKILAATVATVFGRRGVRATDECLPTATRRPDDPLGMTSRCASRKSLPFRKH